MKTYTKGIILNADDYGAMDFIDKGIEEGIEAGVINSVSTFVTFGAKNLNQIKYLKNTYGDKIGIGLHFTITSGKPIGSKHEVETLYHKKGKHSNKFTLLKNLDLKRISRAEVKLEIEKQLQTLGDILGGVDKIDHINSHQGLLYFIPSFWEILQEIVQQPEYKNLPIRSVATYEMKHTFLTDLLPALPITRLGASNIKLFINLGTARTIKIGNKVPNLRKKQTEAEEKGLCLPSYFIQSYFGQPNTAIIKKFVSEIEDKEVGEFMLHIGRGDYNSEFHRKKHWGIKKISLKHREEELKVLLNSNILELLESSENNIKLINYRDITPRN